MRKMRQITMQEMETYASLKNRILIVYQNAVYDLTEFKHFHPGGNKAIEYFNCQCVDNFLFSPQMVSFHDKDILVTLKDYQCAVLIQRPQANRSQSEKFISGFTQPELQNESQYQIRITKSQNQGRPLSMQFDQIGNSYSTNELQEKESNKKENIIYKKWLEQRKQLEETKTNQSTFIQKQPYSYQNSPQFRESNQSFGQIKFQYDESNIDSPQLQEGTRKQKVPKLIPQFIQDLFFKK